MKTSNKMNLFLRGLKNPTKAINYIVRLIDGKFRFTENAKVSGGGERLVIKKWELAKKTQDFTLSHIQRYEWALPYIKNLDCLDIGCGCGYGTYFLARNGANKVIGIDISSEAIRFAQKYYRSENIEFFQMDALNLNFEDNSFDAVICFEILEHLKAKDQEKLLAEATRVLKNNGVIYISTPNAPIHRGKYPFHWKELSRAEFEQLLFKFFKDVKVFGQDIIINGIRQKANWRQYLSNLSYENFIIVESDTESCYGLLAIAKNKKI
jgi:2-polyprenyl-3-methyl-5-hydroxy-6-metoxy-1,4-benzoquinol methylase